MAARSSAAWDTRFNVALRYCSSTNHPSLLRMLSSSLQLQFLLRAARCCEMITHLTLANRNYIIEMPQEAKHCVMGSELVPAASGLPAHGPLFLSGKGGKDNRSSTWNCYLWKQYFYRAGLVLGLSGNYVSLLFLLFIHSFIHTEKKDFHRSLQLLFFLLLINEFKENLIF